MKGSVAGTGEHRRARCGRRCGVKRAGARNTDLVFLSLLRDLFDMRRSPAGRERAIRGLKARYAEGRITTRQLEMRVERVLRSGPTIEYPPVHGLGALIARRVRRFQRALLRMHAFGYVAANAALVGIWALMGEGSFWPALFLVPSTLVLGGHALASRKLTRAISRLRLSA